LLCIDILCIQTFFKLGVSKKEHLRCSMVKKKKKKVQVQKQNAKHSPNGFNRMGPTQNTVHELIPSGREGT